MRRVPLPRAIPYGFPVVYPIIHPFSLGRASNSAQKSRSTITPLGSGM